MSRDELDLSLDSSSNEGESLDLQGEQLEHQPELELHEELKLQGEEERDLSEEHGPENTDQASAGEVLFDGLEAAEDAGDFLGLDTELHFSTDPAGGANVDTGLGLEEGPASSMELERAPGSFDATDASLDGETPQEDLFPDDEIDAELDGEYEYAEDDGGPHKGILILSAFAIGALVVVGAVFGPGLMDSTGTETSGEIAANTPANSAPDSSAVDSSVTGQKGPDAGVNNTQAGNPIPNPAGTTEPTLDTPGQEDPFFASADGVPTPPVKNGEGGSLERLFSSGTFDLVPRVPSTSASNPSGARPRNLAGGQIPSVDQANPNQGGASLGSSGGGLPQSGASQNTAGGNDLSAEQAALFAGGLGWAGTGDVDIVWRRGEVPTDAIDAPTRVATPRVGTVRVHLNDGDFFEGTLVAVGEGRVWIETTPGRMAFKSASITSIESLGLELAVSDPGAINAPKRGERVRIHAPGGLIYGHVVSQAEDGSVTLRTDQGGKVTIASAAIETVGNSRAVIVQD